MFIRIFAFLLFLCSGVLSAQTVGTPDGDTVVNKKKTINDADFFPEGSEVDVKIKQLKRLLKQHFDAQV